MCGNCRWCGRPGTILVSKVWSTVHHFLSFNIVNGSVRLYKGHHAEAADQELPVPKAGVAHPTAKNPRYSCFCSRHNFTFSLRRFPTSPCLTAKKEMHSYRAYSKSFWLLFGTGICKGQEEGPRH